MSNQDNNESAVNISGDNQSYSDNVSFNSSSISMYSAEELIIQQRGRKSPKKRAYDEDHFFHHHAPYQQVSTGDMFLKLKQTSMRSPDSKNLQPSQEFNSPHNVSVDSGRSSLNAYFDEVSSPTKSCRKSKRNLNKSLLRTPVKRRLTLRRVSSSTIKKHRRRS